MTMKQGVGRILTGNFKIIHAINISHYDEVISSIKLTVKYRVNRTSILVPQLNHRISEIERLIDQLRYREVRRSSRSINWLGSAWKWLAGSPDATDWDSIVKSQNNIIDNNNKQYRINRYISRVSTELIDNYNRIVADLATLNNDKYEQTLFNKMTILKEEIEEIVLANQLAKRGIVNSKLLDRVEVNEILAQVETLPYSNDIQAIEYAEPMVLVKDSILLYVVCLPKTGGTDFNHLLIRPTIKDGKMIYINYSSLFLSHKEKYGVSERCSEIQGITICNKNQLRELRSTECLYQILQGTNAICDYQFHNSPVVELINENTLYLTNFVGKLNYDNTTRVLNGTFLINFQNDTVQVDDVKYTSREIRSFHLLPSILTSNLTENDVKVDIEYLHKLHLDNIKRLENLTSNNIVSIASDTVIAIVTLSLAAIVLFLFLRRRNTSLKLETNLPYSHPDPIRLQF